VNSRAELAHLELEWQRRRREQVLHEGATLIDPESVWFAYDTRLGRDVTVEPHVVFGPGVEVASPTARHTIIGARASIQPYGPEASKGEGGQSELKNAAVAKGAKASYVGPFARAPISARGSPAIRLGKYRTVIGAGAFIGSKGRQFRRD
jgi:bifunctional UDP-N-acetylglucosamine pyrophosphorylase / glucosamine-1-phosphate N-acetyltransferase